MRLLIAPLLLALAACGQLQDAGSREPIGSANIAAPKDQQKSLEEKGVAPTAEEAKLAEAFKAEAVEITKRAGDMHEIKVTVKPGDRQAQLALMRLLTDEYTMPVKSEKQEDGTTIWTFLRAVKLRQESPLKDRPGIVGTPSAK